MRSDPQGRWSAVNFAALACRIIERVEQEVDESVTSQEYSRIQTNLQRILNYKMTSISDELTSADSIREFRKFLYPIYLIFAIIKLITF